MGVNVSQITNSCTVQANIKATSKLRISNFLWEESLADPAQKASDAEKWRHRDSLMEPHNRIIGAIIRQELWRFITDLLGYAIQFWRSITANLLMELQKLVSFSEFP